MSSYEHPELAMGGGIPVTDRLTQDRVTVAQAADLLHVNQSTIRRWIREGKLPAYRVGERRLALRVADLDRVVSPVREVRGGREPVGETRPVGRRLTPDEVRRGLEAIDRAEERAKRITARRGGRLFSPSWEILNELRDERTRQRS